MSAYETAADITICSNRRLCRGRGQGWRDTGNLCAPQVTAHGGVAAVLVMMAIVSALGTAVTAILARKVGEIPEGRTIDEAEAR
jgi:hypothetical protein